MSEGHDHHDHDEEENSLASLKVSVRDGKVCEKILKIEISGEEIEREYEDFYRHLAPKAKVPGFRPGKAPRHVLALHYSGEAREKVLERLVSESYHQAVREQSIEPLGMPDIKDINFGDDSLSYEALVETRPKIKLSKVTGLSAKKEKPEVKEEEIQDTLKKIQESLAQYKAVEDRGVVMGDYVIADYVCQVDGKEVEKRSDDWFEIREDDFLKGFSKQLLGAKAGDDKTVEVTFPADFGKKTLAGKPAKFQIKVKEIKIKQLPELNDEMAQSAGEFKTFADLKERILKDALAAKDREAQSKYEKALLDEFLKHNKLELPEGLVQRRHARLLENAVKNFKEHGGPDAKIEELKAKISKDLEAEARRQIHLAFLLDEVATQEKLEVSDEDFKAKYEHIALDVRQPADVVQKYYAEHEEAKDSLWEQIRTEKAIDFIRKNAKSE